MSYANGVPIMWERIPRKEMKMNSEDAMIMVDRLNRAVETLRKINLSRLSPVDRVNITSAQTDIIDTVNYIEAIGPIESGNK